MSSYFRDEKKNPHMMINEGNGGRNHKSMYLNRTCQKSGMIDAFPLCNASLNDKDIYSTLNFEQNDR